MKLNFALATSLLLLLTSCVSVRTTTSQHVFGNEKIKEITSEGKACGYMVLGFIFGDMTVDKAAKNSNISEISFVEESTESHLFYTSLCTIVKGK